MTLRLCRTWVSPWALLSNSFGIVKIEWYNMHLILLLKDKAFVIVLLIFVLIWAYEILFFFRIRVFRYRIFLLLARHVLTFVYFIPVILILTISFILLVILPSSSNMLFIWASLAVIIFGELRWRPHRAPHNYSFWWFSDAIAKHAWDLVLEVLLDLYLAEIRLLVLLNRLYLRWLGETAVGWEASDCWMLKWLGLEVLSKLMPFEGRTWKAEMILVIEGVGSMSLLR